MAGISALNTATASLQSQLSRARIDQARREADQSEAQARDLRSQADQAEREANQGQQRVRQLISGSQVNEDTYSFGSNQRQSPGRFVNVTA